MDYYSPLRYPGGKGKVSEYFKLIYRDNNLYDGVYVEPFAGGASVALSLLFNEYASKIFINDIDLSIFSFWHSVLNETEALCKTIQDTPVNIDTWQKQRAIQNNKKSYGLLEIGFSTFFMNRTNRSGIIGAGVIGGKNQDGNWKIDARYNKPDLIRRIERIAEYKNRINLYNLDAVALLKNIHKQLPEKTLFYFDPPYYIKGKDLYLNYYKHDDHSEIANEINKLEAKKWIITYDNVLPIKELYNKHRQLDFTLNYSAGYASKGSEVMIFSDNLNVPNDHKWHLEQNI